MLTSSRLYWMQRLIESELRDRIQAVKEKGKTCSLFLAMLDTQIATWNDDLKTIVEAIEDAESL